MPMDRSRALAGLILLVALPVGAQDLTIVSRHSRGDHPPTTQTTYLSRDRMRMAAPDGNDSIVDYASGNITVIDNKKKQYFVMTPADMEAAAAKMKEMRAKMRASMEKMSPEIRKKMAGAMGGVADAVKVEKGTGGRTVAGYACENWIVTIGSFSRQENCVTTQLQFPPAVYDGMKKMAERMRGAGGATGDGMSGLWEKFREMKGFPVATTATTNVMGHSETSKTEVTEVKKGPIPDSAFEVPAGYKKVESPMSKMGRHAPPK
jgi:Domain of unknown function (DUF4412)